MSERPIPNAVPHLAGNEWRYLKECLDTKLGVVGRSFVDRFERETAAAVGAAHAVAAVTGTAALHVALLTAGVLPGDEVLVPTLTFIATANAVCYCGAVPVFVDVEPRRGAGPGKVEDFLAKECDVRGGVVVNARPAAPCAPCCPSISTAIRGSRRVPPTSPRGGRWRWWRTLRNRSAPATRARRRRGRTRRLPVVQRQQDRHRGRRRHAPDQRRGGRERARSLTTHARATRRSGSTARSATTTGSRTSRPRSGSPSSSSSAPSSRPSAGRPTPTRRGGGPRGRGAVRRAAVGALDVLDVLGAARPAPLRRRARGRPGGQRDGIGFRPLWYPLHRQPVFAGRQPTASRSPTTSTRAASRCRCRSGSPTPSARASSSVSRVAGGRAEAIEAQQEVAETPVQSLPVRSLPGSGQVPARRLRAAARS